MTGDLTTLANVKGYIPNLGTNTTFDGLLTRLITAASAWIKSYLNRDILTASYTDTLDGSGSSRQVLPQSPISGVTSLTVDGLAVDPANVVFRNASLTRTDGQNFTYGNANVVVTYTAGYATVPYDIEQACIELVAWRFQEKDRIGLASKTLNPAGAVEAYQTKDVPASVQTMLNSWRKVVPV